MKYQLTSDQVDRLAAASLPTPAVTIGGAVMPTAQDRANAEWQAIGAEVGFDWATVTDLDPFTHRFTAVPL